MCRQINTHICRHTNSISPYSPPVCLSVWPISLLIPLSLSISEEDLMNISLWVGECKTFASLVLLSLRVLPWRWKCEMHEKAVRQKITYSILAFALPPLLSPNPPQPSDHLQQHGKRWWQRDSSITVAARTSLPPKLKCWLLQIP